MKTTQLVDVFGSNRMNAKRPGELLRGCTCIQVPFAGGMCEVPHFTANVVNVNDLNRAVVNLALVVADEREQLVRRLDSTPFHPEILELAQRFCEGLPQRAIMCPDWAYHYFIASWMTRGGKGGTKGEFDSGLSVRWKSGGGDSVVRFRSATAALAEWEQVMRRCTFHTMDAFDFLAECKKRDVAENGIYADPPWPQDGDAYKHQLGAGGHAKLRDILESFERTRIVVRFGDCDQIRDLYRPERWTRIEVEGRTQANATKAEVLLCRNLGKGKT